MEPAADSIEQMVNAAAAAALAASGQRAQNFTAQDLLGLRAQVVNSVVNLEKVRPDNGKRMSTPGTIIGATPTYCYVLVHKNSVDNCELVFTTDGARFQLEKDNFITNDSDLAVVKINHGSMVPVQFTEKPASFVDSVYLYVRGGRGLTPGCVVNPTGESKPSHFPGSFLIDNGPDFSSEFGAPVFDESGEFLGIVISRSSTCLAVGVSKIKERLRQKLPQAAREELTSLKVL